MPLVPEKSELYSYRTVTVPAVGDREAGLVACEGDTLEICYRKYTAATQPAQPVNLVFLHGNGMNKGIWHAMIDVLYAGGHVATVLAFDLVNHGELAVANEGKLGKNFLWRDGSRDVVEATRNEHLEGPIVIVGHSMGGCMALSCLELAPALFAAGVVVNPIAISDEAFRKRMPQVLPKWLERGYLEDGVRVSGAWQHDVAAWFATKSFYTRLHPEYRHNLVCDEVTRYQPGTAYEYVRFNTSAEAQIANYVGAPRCCEVAMQFYPNIRAPVYHCWGTKDTTPRSRAENLRALLPIKRAVDMEDCFHLVNGEKPEVVIGIVSDVIGDVVSSSPSSKL